MFSLFLQTPTKEIASLDGLWLNISRTAGGLRQLGRKQSVSIKNVQKPLNPTVQRVSSADDTSESKSIFFPHFYA